MYNATITGERIKELRGKKSQDQCAKELGISRGALSFYENGERKPDAEILYRMCEYFSVSADYLLGLSNVKSTDIDINTTRKTTGLSEGAIHTFQYKSINDPFFMVIFNKLIETETKVNGDGLFTRIVRYFATTPANGKIIIDKIGRFRTAKYNASIKEDEIEIDMCKFINSQMINSIIQCLKDYTQSDDFGRKSDEYAAIFNAHREFEQILCEELPVYTTSEMIELGLFPKDFDEREACENAEHNPTQE